MPSQFCSLDWQDKDATWTLVVNSLTPPKKSSHLLPSLPESKVQHYQMNPALIAREGAGTLKNKMNRCSLLVRHLIPSKYAPKAFKKHLTLNEY